MRNYFRKKFSWGIASFLFLAACGIKWYFLARQGYYIRFSDELPGAYHLAATYDLPSLLKQIFLECNCTLNSVRPFFVTLLYVLTFKLFGLWPQSAWVLGIFVGSLLVPLYYGVIRRLICAETAFFSSFVLLFMSNYISQSIALTTILPGTIFILGALLAAIRFYEGRGKGYLYLSGFLVSMSVFCRYENAFFVPAFVGYCYLFDRKGSKTSKLFYGLLCAGSSLYILYCNHRLYGDFFYMIRLQSLVIHQTGGRSPVHLMKTFMLLWDMSSRLLQAWVWWVAAGGAIMITLQYRLRGLWFFLGMSFWTGPLVYKLKEGTLDINKDYFLLLALVALPAGLECLRSFVVRAGGRKAYGAIALGIATGVIVYSFLEINFRIPDPRLKYSREFINLTVDLKNIPSTSALYIENGLIRPDFDNQSVLIYLKRDPQKYQYCFGKTTPLEEEYYFLTKEDQIDRVPKKEAVKVRDYRDFGLENTVLYRIIQRFK